MDLQTRKLEFIREFLNIQDGKLISQLENILYRGENISFNSFSKDEFNKRIDKSEDDFKNGRFKTTSQLLEKYK